MWSNRLRLFRTRVERKRLFEKKRKRRNFCAYPILSLYMNNIPLNLITSLWRVIVSVMCNLSYLYVSNVLILCDWYVKTTISVLYKHGTDTYFNIFVILSYDVMVCIYQYNFIRKLYGINDFLHMYIKHFLFLRHNNAYTTHCAKFRFCFRHNA